MDGEYNRNVPINSYLNCAGEFARKIISISYRNLFAAGIKTVSLFGIVLFCLGQIWAMRQPK